LSEANKVDFKVVARSSTKWFVLHEFPWRPNVVDDEVTDGTIWAVTGGVVFTIGDQMHSFFELLIVLNHRNPINFFLNEIE
jgi:hypothetical protein